MVSLQALRLIQQHSTQIRALLASPRPRSVSPARTEPLNMTSTYRARGKMAGVLFKPSPLMDLGRTPVRLVPKARPSITIPVRPRASPRTEARSRSASLNARVLGPLGAMYPAKTSDIVSQAENAFFYHNRKAETTPEIYELFEGGYLDEAIESLGLRRWSIGRPKTD